MAKFLIATHSNGVEGSTEVDMIDLIPANYDGYKIDWVLHKEQGSDAIAITDYLTGRRLCALEYPNGSSVWITDKLTKEDRRRLVKRQLDLKFFDYTPLELKRKLMTAQFDYPTLNSMEL